MSGITKSIGRAFKRLDGKTVASAALLAVGGYYLAGGFDSGGSLADSVAPGGGDESAGLDMNSTPASAGSFDESAPLNFTGSSTPLPEPGPMDVGSTPGVDPGAQANTVLTVPPDVTSPAPTPDTTQPAPSPTASQGSSAPVSATSTTAGLPPVIDKSVPAGTGNVGNLGTGGLTGTMNWFKSLSPPAQAAIAGGVAGGAGALMNALAQKHAQEFQYEQEQRKREDVIRRGQVPALAAGGITPGRGIIDMTRGT